MKCPDCELNMFKYSFKHNGEAKEGYRCICGQVGGVNPWRKRAWRKNPVRGLEANFRGCFIGRDF